MNNKKNKAIILFDGVCNLCNASVNFIIKHDTTKQFLFASLQSDATKEILLQHTVKKTHLNSIVLIEKGKVYYKSTAILRILKQLKKGIHLLYFFIIIPLFIRDWIYTLVANNRYKWFGRKNKCMIPTSDFQDRFLD